MKKINFGQVMTIGKTITNFCKAHKRTIKKTIKYTCGAGAIAYGVAKAPKTFNDIQEAGEKKGEALTFTEKAGIVLKNQYPAIIMGGVAVGTDISLDVDSSKELKAVNEEKESLIGQIAELGNAYNTVNTIKDAMSKKVVETQGEEVANEVRDKAIEQTTTAGVNRLSTQLPYVANRSKLEEWNSRYLETGDPDFKIQECYIGIVGQKILTCRHAIKCADRYLNNAMDPEKGRGFIDLNAVLEEVGGRTIDGPLGENVIWRYMYENFSMYTTEVMIDGVAMLDLRFASEPYYDKSREYWGI